MSEIEDKLREIRNSIAAVTSKKARAVVELDNAKSRLDDARRILRDDFGVETSDEAKAKLSSLRSELARVVSQLESELDNAGA